MARLESRPINDMTCREDGLAWYLMMVCIPRTCGVLSITLSVAGRGCPWWAEARADLGGLGDGGESEQDLFKS